MQYQRQRLNTWRSHLPSPFQRSLVLEDAAPAPAVTCSTPAPETDCVTHSPVMEYIAPAPPVVFDTPSQMLPPSHIMAAVTTLTPPMLYANHLARSSVLQTKFRKSLLSLTPVHEAWNSQWQTSKPMIDLMVNKPEQMILFQSADAASSIPVRTPWGACMGACAAHEEVSDHDLVLRVFRRGDDELEKGLTGEVAAVAP